MAWRLVHFEPFDASEGDRRWQKAVRAWLAEAGQQEPSTWTLRAAAGRYLQHRAAAGCSPRFAAREYYRLSAWLRWTQVRGIEKADQLDQALAEGYLRWCREELHHASRTLRANRQMLYAFAQFLCHIGISSVNPVTSVMVPRPRATRVERVLSLAELNALVETLSRRAAQLDHRWGWHHRRDLLMCKVLIATGVRASELCALRCCDFDPAAGTLTVAGKGSGPFAIQGRRVFVCDPRLLAELQSWTEGRSDPRQSLFPPRHTAPAGQALTPGAVDRMIKIWAVLASLGRPLHAHLFRHSFCSHLIANGADVYSVQQLMGHRRVEVTLEVYLHLSESEVREQWLQHTPLAAGR